MNASIRAALAAAFATPVWAQSTLPPVLVTGNPLGSTEVATPSSLLSGNGLVLRRAGTLGETLDGLPGVAASAFGPNASRPVIRGQDGDRIRVLNNAGASLDASALSFDHAVPIDPLVVERLEVLRGPAALLYGGSAVGGVVNAIDNRIPRARIDGVEGAAETRLGGAAGERAVSARIEAGRGGFAWHADAFTRRTDDLRVPAFDRPLDGGGSERRTRVVNSASEAHGGALGGSWVWENGHLGASVDRYANDYGIVAEDDVTIRMRRDRFALAGEWRLPAAFFTTLRAQAARTDYRHEEVEGDGAIGTTFKTRGSDGRFEAVHRALPLAGGQLQGSWGLQFESARFSALGEEAFVPSTDTRQSALFALERWSWRPGSHLGAGLRAERVRVASDGDADPTEPQFGPAQQRRFAPRSASFEAVFALAPGWQLSSTASTTERAPTSYELYANGLHAATGAFERGDPDQALERGRQLDLALAWKSADARLQLSAFRSRFSNYILLAATGEPDFVDDEGGSHPVFAFRGVRARLQGLELEGSWRLPAGAQTWVLDGQLDRVKGTDLDRGEPLPRLSPLRARIGLAWLRGAWALRADLRHARAQNRVPATDAPTPGWTQLDLSASVTLDRLANGALLFVKLQNAGDELAYNAATIATVRGLSPLPGRSLSAGLRVAF